MAGSEKSGYEHSSGALYRGASVIITPHQKNDAAIIETVERFWKSLGSRTVLCDAQVHDRLVALTSHVPHLVACAVADLVADASVGTDISRRLSAAVSATSPVSPWARRTCGPT